MDNSNIIRDEVLEQYLALEEKIKKYNPSVNVERLRYAYEFARESHGDQKRKDGSLFVTHPIATADIVADMELDEDSVIACLLHDVVEDTPVTAEEIAKRFGKDVALLVEGVTKLTRVVYTSKEEEQVENLRKMLMAMAKDIRVIIIKVSDRLHNMRTMNYQSAEKQRKKALETMEIYAPIAHRLGMQRVKWELEDLSLIYLDPIGYQEITCQLDNRRKTLETFMNDISNTITERMSSVGVECKVFSRLKHIYSIYRKMYSQNKEFNEVLDLCAFRIIVGNVSDCYNALGQIHDLYNPMPGRFKDYISTPKPNMYQSLHTTVIGDEGMPFEVQIRTWEMHRTAEYGVAAHWKYKQGIGSKTGNDEEKFAWIRSLLETQQASDAADFVHGLKTDMFADEVFVFTPQGEVINLPAGATPIDFAYSIHTAVGNLMTGARVNGRIATFDHILENGDIVEIMTSPSANGPSRDWMQIAKSSQAKGKIKQWFKKEKREENIVHGKAAFEAEMKRNNLSLNDLSGPDAILACLKKLSFSNFDDMYAAIGYGGLTSVRAVNRFREDIVVAKRQKRLEEKAAEATKESQQQPVRAEKRQHSVRGVVVGDLDNCLIKFARCCTPVPGDKIVGFITKGYGVSVHRAECQNRLNSGSRDNEDERWIDVSWGDIGSETYNTALTISARDRRNFVLDIATVLATAKVKITSLSAREVEGGQAVAFVSMDVHTRAELQAAIHRLSVIKGVTEVKRPGV
ncbi:MAG: bifunctional (p)ppGpp synthetase/guanosine-3',5'-bis(diphosphate) 3'-pyrophosphohydrolase [Oscillospiraceae bacterium]|nr:bifunctional (p)ppGpp synthetase/guanosine-3',5'-bis(diphosphate) 3'-pyrophosphohydrolase [Oscillospiraceae bacterium]